MQTMLYLIFGHNKQDQLVRLCSAIRQLSPQSRIAIHFDNQKEKLDINKFIGLDAHIIPNPIQGEWGGYSLVEQYIHSIQWCINYMEWDWCCTLTGLSYPINNLKNFEKELFSSDYDAYIRYFDALNTPEVIWPKNEGKKRYLYKYFCLPKIPYFYKVPNFLIKIIDKFIYGFNRAQVIFRIIPLPRGAKTRFGILRTKWPLDKNFKLYAGRQMINVNKNAVQRILDYLKNNQDYEKFFKRTLIPDEAFFISILMNSPEIKINNNVKRYIKWPEIGAESAAIIPNNELVNAIESGQPFGLKFDMSVDSQTLDSIDFILGINHQTIIP